MARSGEDGTSAGKEGVDFEWVGDGLKTKRFFTRAEKAARSGGGDKPAAAAKPKPKARTSASTRSSTPAAKPKRDIADMAEDAIDRSAPTRPKARPGTTRPKARSGPGPNAKTATSVSTPKVTTSKLPARGSESKGSGSTATTSSSGSSSKKPFAGTKPTREEWEKMTVAQRAYWGVILPPRGTKSSEVPDGEPKKDTRRMGQNAPKNSNPSGKTPRMVHTAVKKARGGLIGKSGYAKGGMVKANCGASMKPTQKSTRKK